ncbi:Asp-tRNA(Asn)/Glu-tRNA(Gln) amidotransferase subunit GatB [Candidatus Falkowbacteria bacterium CG_4_9_14_3_um_filter_36_9]|uniref:Aspartyl/glutamyl-tRNA(Asn/Gln) amidotransferase subunit B n=1 Tax=Candidatus Falkowbacteria bacterium CG02_land_8_20_14_3_00_36_14 TaxID=1974560 RepID=A0A2M7DL86_9BACT|nr:MAG: Asp-tRNA(Asn)/Glu-tRNA(Gln) amidotransferase subunit GatB [Candidatus Falkowbacteria bacterium CG02_land_8_20_14_3_00_36_14]PIX10978.1 MAG: Asp-tRNA(Asn)/Glu-tRNA(Gln) amidotransferase subunit GatB [Candidatus Falkowbacteria bacterium CG_4_8_14_3_um_filter_36_11]PJA10155.1 MAG: Asp-tRNA(Asn)/Glu-tRNA(Gln) amidotransferase subunit GatB [Candidatus Falkowbacteria bacterium CG_4_10_14_0_2_um_filter_36_22]PJB20747.1 MAG: Asp-tRNA(Asn)/Glu-tRNA(Gln) amidotransferase subunit GatB [Candidatus F
MAYDVIIGLEIHAELKTKSKMFCACDNDAEGKKPNTVVCPICLGHPGTLPAANKQAIEWTILTGLALHGKINTISKFDRKNYFYPDLPKGYQISQYDLPLVYNGYLEIDGENIAITRIHLEEDTGKLTHPVSAKSSAGKLNGKNYSLVDYNRAGTPLMEMVTEPVIKSAEQAKKFCQAYQQILRYLDISDADMEKGQMRCEANVSIQKKSKWEYKGDGVITAKGNYKLNPKVELKNINSFRALEKAIAFEIKRQTQALNDGEKLIQETRGWNENKGITVSQRTKETSADYRYFPEPDIPPLSIDSQLINNIKSQLIELPLEKKKRFIAQYYFDQNTAAILVNDKNLADYTEKVISELRAWIDSTGDNWERQNKKLSKITANWLISELFKHLKKDNLNIKNIKITPENFAELITLVYQGKINSSVGQTLLEEMYKNGGDPSQIMETNGLEQLDDRLALKKIIKKIIKDNKKQVAEYKSGKANVFQYFIGQTMSATKGKANPKIAAKILKKLLA